MGRQAVPSHLGRERRTRAPANPFGLLPEAVLLQIIRDECTQPAQKAAYKSCKDIRDFCNRNMRAVQVELWQANSPAALQEVRRKTMCPMAAYSIERLTISFYPPWTNNCSHAYSYLNKLINDAFSSAETQQCRRKQLANVWHLDLELPVGDGMTSEQCQIVSNLLCQFPNLRCLRTNIAKPWLPMPQLTQLVSTDVVTPETLQLLTTVYPGLQSLDLVCIDSFIGFKPQLLKLTALQHLKLKGTDALSLSLSAKLLSKLTQLSTLALHNVTVDSVHLLSSLRITHLTLGLVDIGYVDQPQLQPVEWPVLKSVDFTHSHDPYTETLVRAILPLPHSGFTVTWPTNTGFRADLPPHPQFGYLGIAHMKSMVTVWLSGNHSQKALRAMVQHQVDIKQTLCVLEGALSLGKDDVPAFLAFPSLRSIHLHTLSMDTLESIFRLFLQCPLLDRVAVPKSCFLLDNDDDDDCQIVYPALPLFLWASYSEIDVTLHRR